VATFTALRAVPGQPLYGHGMAGNVKFDYGVIEIAANPTAADIYKMCIIPSGVAVVDGFVKADDLDTNATETLNMDVGWGANGVDAADPDGFGNLGVWTGDLTLDVKPETQIWYPFNGVLKDGPKTFGADTTIEVVCNVTAATSGLGTLYVGVYYLVP